MALALKVPHGATFDALIPLWPVFMSYVLSFIHVGIYWNKLQYANHHCAVTGYYDVSKGSVMHGNRRLFDLVTKNSQKVKFREYIERLPATVAGFMQRAQHVFHPEVAVIAGNAMSKAGRLHDGLLPVEPHTQIMETSVKCRAKSTLLTWIDALPNGTYLLVVGGGNAVRFDDELMWVSELPGQYVALPDDKVQLHKLIDSDVEELLMVAVNNTSAIIVEAVSGVIPEEPPVDREVVFELTLWGSRILDDRES